MVLSSVWLKGCVVVEFVRLSKGPCQKGAVRKMGFCVVAELSG